MPAKLSSEPVLYPRVDWFDHYEQNECQQDEENEEQKPTKEYVLLNTSHSLCGKVL